MYVYVYVIISICLSVLLHLVLVDIFPECILFESIDPIFFDIFSPRVEPVFSAMSIQNVTHGMCMLDFNDPNLNSSFYYGTMIEKTIIYI